MSDGYANMGFKQDFRQIGTLLQNQHCFLRLIFDAKFGSILTDVTKRGDSLVTFVFTSVLSGTLSYGRPTGRQIHVRYIFQVKN